MQRDRIKRIYDLHAWSGVVCGLYVFIVSLSGVFALFGDELHSWEDENLRIAVSDQPVPVMPLLTEMIEGVSGGDKLESVSVRFPSATEPFYAGFVRTRSKETRKATNHFRRWNPNTGKRLPERGDGFVHWLVDFHRNLMLERTLGRALVGLAGIFLLLSIVSGIVTHRKLLREAFTWRLDRSVRLKWQDSHKAIGLWGLPFHIMIAFTGAWLGLVAIMLPLTAAVTFKGDQGAIFAAVFGVPPQPAGKSAPMYSIDEARRLVSARVTGPVTGVSVENWGDQNALYTFHYDPEGVLLSGAGAKVNGVTGEIQSVNLMSKPGLAPRVLGALTPLHYALYGGIWLKFIYAALGILLSIVIAMGLMMWLERRLHGNEARRSPEFYKMLSRTTVGATTGMALASFAVFYADRLIKSAPDERTTLIGATYFSVWGLAVLYGLLRRNEYRTCKEILAATGLLSVALPMLDLCVSRPAAASMFELPFVLGTNCTAFFVGLILLAVSVWLPSRRPS